MIYSGEVKKEIVEVCMVRELDSRNSIMESSKERKEKRALLRGEEKIYAIRRSIGDYQSGDLSG